MKPDRAKGLPELLILVDEQDNPVGTASREDCHRGSGLLHRAFVLLVENDREQVLLQRRSRSKLGGDRWDVSAASHVRSDETYETAIARCIAHELGITQPISWRRMASYVYTESLGESSENEFCALYAARYEGVLHPNPAEVDALRWVSLSDLAAEIRADPVQYTAWLKEAASNLSG